MPAVLEMPVGCRAAPEPDSTDRSADSATCWAVCAAESYPQDEDSVRLLAMALLAVLGEDGVPRTGGLWGPVHAALHDLCDRYDKSSWEPVHAADRYHDLATGTPLAGLLALLA